jgi:hypothetical protein
MPVESKPQEMQWNVIEAVGQRELQKERLLEQGKMPNVPLGKKDKQGSYKKEPKSVKLMLRGEDKQENVDQKREEKKEKLINLLNVSAF